MFILWWIIVGLVAGWVTGKIMRGEGYGTIVDIVLGVGGAVIGGFIMRALGFSPAGGRLYDLGGHPGRGASDCHRARVQNCLTYGVARVLAPMLSEGSAERLTTMKSPRIMELLWQIEMLERLIASPSTPAGAIPWLQETVATVKSELNGAVGKSSRKSGQWLRVASQFTTRAME